MAAVVTNSVRVVTITVDELERVVDAAVRRALSSAPPSEWLSADDAAALLGVARSSIPVMVRRDGLPAHRAGRAYRFKRSELEAWLEDRATRPGGHSARHGSRLVRLKGG